VKRCREDARIHGTSAWDGNIGDRDSAVRNLHAGPFHWFGVGVAVLPGSAPDEVGLDIRVGLVAGAGNGKGCQDEDVDDDRVGEIHGERSRRLLGGV
jgi:hypothetical protein